MRLSSLASFVVVVAMGSTGAAVQQAGRTDTSPRDALMGTWVLDEESSSTPPRDAVPDDRGGAGAPGGRPPGRGPGMGGPGGQPPPGMGGDRGGPGGEGSRPSPEEMKRMRDLMRELMEAPSRLTIARDGDAVALVDEDGRVRKYVADGKTEKHQLSAGTVQTKARWDGPSLVIEMEAREGFKVKRTFALEPGTGRLAVTTSVEGSRAPQDRPPLKAVYDRAS